MSGTVAPASVGNIDSSIPLRAGSGVAQPNPLQQLGQFAGIQNALNTAKLFPLIQQQHQLQIQQQQSALDLSQMQQHLTRLDYGGAMMMPMLFDPETGKATTGISAKDITSTLATAVGDGFMKPDDAVKILSTLPNGGDDPALNRKWVVQHFAANRGARGQVMDVLTALGQAPATRDTGQEVQSGGVAGPLTGQAGSFRQAGAPTQVYPSRGTLLTQQPGVGPSGEPTSTPLVTRAGQQGRGDLAGPAGALGGGNLPASLRNPARQPETQNSRPPGAVTIGLSPAQSAAQAQTGGQSAQAFQGIADQAVKAAAQDATLATMQADASQFITGPGADAIRKFKSAVVRVGDALGRDFGIDKGSLAANESFDKLANQIADAQGAGSDARLAVNQAANPSSHLTPEGVDLILRQLRGNTDYLRARAKLASAYPDKSDREGFEASIGSNLDPRVFQYQRMTPEQRGTYFRGLKDKAAFKKAYLWAEQQQLVGGPSGGQ